MDNQYKDLEQRMTRIENAILELKDSLNSTKRNYTIETREVEDADDKPMTTEQKKIESIMEDFDFNRVHDVMYYLDWQWAQTGVPTVDEIKKEARRLLEEAVKEKTYIATGGLRACYDNGGNPDDPDPYIGLEFILTDMEGFADD